MKSSITRSSSCSAIWAWPTARPGLGYDLPQARCQSLDVGHAVVDEEHLPAAVELPEDRVAHQRGIEPRDPGLHGQPILRRGLQVGDVAQPQQGHVQRPRNGRGGHRQHVDDVPQGLQPLLHLHAESLLLVDNHQPEVVEPHVPLGEPVRADHDVDRPARQALDDLALLLARGETRERCDLKRKLRHPALERPGMLFGQNGGRHQHGHLVAGVHGLERRPHRHLRLPEAHVAAQQPVHGPRLGHVALDRLDGRQLVEGLVVRKRGVELLLPFGVVGKRDARPRCSGGLQFEHLRGHVGHGVLHGLLLAGPGPAAELGQPGPALRPAHVLLHQPDLRAGHVELRPLRRTPASGALRPGRSSPAASCRGSGRCRGSTWTTRSPSRSSRKLSMARPNRRCGTRRSSVRWNSSAAGQQHRPLGHQAEPDGQPCRREVEPPARASCVPREEVGQTPHLGLGLADDEHVLARAGRVQLVAHLADVAAEALDRFDLQPAGRLQRARRPRPRRSPTETAPPAPSPRRRCAASCGRSSRSRVTVAPAAPTPPARPAGTSFAAAGSRPDGPCFGLRSRTVISTSSSRARLRWLEISKRRIDSICRRTARSAPGRYQSEAKMSTIPPRSENSPGNSTAEVLWKPLSTSHVQRSGETHFVADAERCGSAAASALPLRHRLQEALDARNEQHGLRGWAAAAGASTPACGRPGSRRGSPDPRAADSQAGNLSTAVRVKSAKSSVRSSIWSIPGQTTTSGAEACSAKAAAASAHDDPQTPSRVGRLSPSQTRDHLGEALVTLQASGQLQKLFGRAWSRLGFGHGLWGILPVPGVRRKTDGRPQWAVGGGQTADRSRRTAEGGGQSRSGGTCARDRRRLRCRHALPIMGDAIPETRPGGRRLMVCWQVDGSSGVQSQGAMPCRS